MTTIPRSTLYLDEKGRISFALVAVIILISSSILTALFNGDRPLMEQEEWMKREEKVVRSIEVDLGQMAIDVASKVAGDDFREGLGPELASGRLHTLFEEGFKGLEVDGWTFDLEKLELGMDLGAQEPMGRVIGKVVWCGNSPTKNTYTRSTRINGELHLPFGLAMSAKDRIEVSGLDGGTLSRSVRSMLFKLGVVRSANGELEARKLLTKEDVQRAFELALDLYLSEGSKDEMPQAFDGTNVSADGGVVSYSVKPEDRFLELLGETRVQSSSIISSMLVGLMDYYVLWFRDYIGVGEGVEGFFEWAGEATTGSTEDTGQWWRSFKFSQLIDQLAFEVLGGVLHMILEMLGTEDMDVRDLDFKDLAVKVPEMVNRSLKDGEGKGFPKEGARVPPDVEEAIRNIPNATADAKNGILDKLADSLEDIRGMAVGAFIKGVRSMTEQTWEGISKIDGLHMISGRKGPGPLELSEAEKRDVSSSNFKMGSMSIERSVLSIKKTIGVKGTHHTAPKERLTIALDTLFDRKGEGEFRDLRPYETDYKVRIEGCYVVQRMILTGSGITPFIESGHVLEANWTVPINITINIPILSGVPLKGVDYDPTNTLAIDMAQVLWDLINWTWEGLSWAAGSMTSMFSGLMDGIRELGRRGLENLGRMSAATFSRTVERVLKAINNRAYNDIMNLTWRFIRDLVGEDLKQMLTFHVEIMGFDLTIEIDIFKERLTLSHLSSWYGFSLTFQRLADEDPPFGARPVEGYRYCLIGTGQISRGDLSVEVGLDPLTLMYPSIVHVSGEMRDDRGKGFSFVLAAPMAYKSTRNKEISISSVTGSAISGIPIPGTGLTMDINAGLRIKYLEGYKKVEKLLIKALRGAWYLTLKGYSVKELFGEIGDPELLEAFIIQLLNNVVNEIGDRFSKVLPEIELFVEGALSAASGTASEGFSLSFVIKDPVKVLWDLLPWFGDNIRTFLLSMSTPNMPPSPVGIPSSVSEHLFVKGRVFDRLQAPDLLGGKGTGSLSIAGSVEVNLPALGALVGADWGRWMVNAGVVIPNLPTTIVKLIPGLDAPRPRCDLWLVELRIMELDNDRAKLSEVYYDTTNNDNEEEFLEIWNPTHSRIDISNWVLEDNGGQWELPDHLSLASDDRLVIARDKLGFRASFGRLPQVWGLPLRLNNDGDAVALMDPYGVEIDEVAWEGWVHGWDGSCNNGESLQRTRSTDSDTMRDWYCAEPDPNH